MTPVQRLAASLAATGPSGDAITPPTIPHQARQAAVLILLTDNEDATVTLIERAATMRHHAGQIAFPGGEVEPEDRSPTVAALRETTEEIGLPSAQIAVLGQLRQAWVPVSGFAVTPIVGTWDGSYPIEPMAREEVAAIHRLPMSTLAEPGLRVSARHPSGRISPAFVVDDIFIWGFTGHLLSWVLDLGGWTRSWDPSRIADVPSRFLRE